MILGMLGGLPGADAADAAKIAIVYTPHRLYRDTAVRIETAVKDRKWSYALIELPSNTVEKSPSEAGTDNGDRDSVPATQGVPTEEARKRLAPNQPTIIVSIGTEATGLALEAIPQVPIVFCMIPNAQDSPLVAAGRYKSRLAGVATDIAPAEQIRLTLEMSPEVKNMGAFHSARTKRTVESLRAAAREKGVTIIPMETNKSDFLKAVELLGANRCDGVIMLPDSDVYNAPTVQRLLLWGLRSRKPVYAFSSKIVKAGALAGWEANEDSIGAEISNLVEKITAGADPASLGVKHPAKIRYSINERSAEMIGISFSDEILDTAEQRFGRND